MPLHIEILYNEYDFVGAFSVAALLACLALVTLLAQFVVERMSARRTTAAPVQIPAEEASP
jgi:sulfate transport system permease protein